MKYKVIKEFVSKKGYLHKVGEEVDWSLPLGTFSEGLIKNGFVETIEPSHDFENWEKNGIKSKLANILIAPEDYIEGDKKHFTWDEAMEIEKKLNNGWRLPSRHEMVLIAEEFSRNVETDELEGKYLQKNLGLRLSGYKSTSVLYNTGTYGFYWSRTASSTTFAYYLSFDSTNIYPAYLSNRYVGYSVRLVKDLES